MSKREFTCIGCPMGCALQVEIENGCIISVTGNTCKRGEEYAKKECTNPTRIVTSSVKVEGGNLNMVSVKTERDIPKEKIFDVLKQLKGIAVEAPVHTGDIILKDAAGTGVNIIATKEINNIV